MGPRKRQEFLGLDSIPFSEARGVREVAGESLVRDAEEKGIYRQKHLYKTKQNTKIKHCSRYF